MSLRPFLLSLSLVIAGLAPAAAQDAQMPIPGSLAEEAPDLHALFDVMGMYDVLEIMANEGTLGAQDLEEELFPGEGGAAWLAMTTRIHSADRITGMFEEAYPRDRLGAEAIADLTEFFASDAGQRLVEGEIAARLAFLDAETEEAATEIYRMQRAANDPRLDQLEAFIDANDLVERNVMGALNSNFAFYRGLADGNAFDVPMPEDLMLAEVWSQEPDLRRRTIDWLYGYQIMAYSDASDADLDAYIAISETEAGRALNAALFDAFDAVMAQLSYDLGAAAAVFIAGEDT